MNTPMTKEQLEKRTDLAHLKELIEKEVWESATRDDAKGQAIRGYLVEMLDDSEPWWVTLEELQEEFGKSAASFSDGWEAALKPEPDGFGCSGCGVLVKADKLPDDWKQKNIPGGGHNFLCPDCLLKERTSRVPYER
ncbi:hypothetical protein LCGC14_1272730 [marine sediment metagenome]|uniref:Uncharacterized protein n=1 Tax=marine sediment metagenome TaxID=412755 RepID=A0A0F9NE96_9ZZZZ